MKVAMEVPNSQTPSAETPAFPGRAQLPSTGVRSSLKESPGEAGLVPPAASAQQQDVTFRRDNNGRIYYVISDAQSGKEIEELPPEAVRQVANGIDEYLKQEQTKHTHLNTKG